MRRPAIAKDLVPVNEFRANMASWMHRLEESGRPVVLTQRGRAAAMLVDPAMFDELEEGRELVKRVLAALEDVDRGAVHDDHEVWGDVDEVIAEAEARARASEVD
jgi:prevent-host-death family protein